MTFSISGGDILGFEADLSYDSSQLSLEGSKSLLGSSWTVKMNGSRIVGYDSEQSNPINGSKQVMAFTFRVKSGASAGSSLCRGEWRLRLLYPQQRRQRRDR